MIIRTSTGRVTTFNDIIDRLYDPSSFLERPWLVDEIARFLDGDRRHLIIVGEPGSGKSAFVAYLASVWNCPRYFIRVDSIRSASGISARAFLVALGTQLYQKYGPDVFPSERKNIEVWAGLTGGRAEVVGQFIDRLYTLPFLPTTRAVELRSGMAFGDAKVIGQRINEVHNITLSLDEPTLLHVTLVAPLRKLHEIAPEEKVVILVDALDEATQLAGKSIIEVIPGAVDPEFPPNLRLVMTSRLGDHLAAFASEDLLYLDDEAKGYLQAAQRDARIYIDKRLKEEPLAKAVAALRDDEVRNLVTEIQKNSASNFLYLFHYFNEVESMVRQGKSLTALSFPKGIDGIYRFFALEKIKGDIDLHDWREIYLPILGILAVAREPLDRKLLASLAGVAIENVDFVIGELGQFLDVFTGTRTNLYRLYHKSFGDYLLDPGRNRDWPLDATKIHGQIVDHFWPTHASGGNVVLKLTGEDDYAYRNLTAHLFQADRIDQLHNLVATGESELVWAEAHYRRFGSYQHYLEDLDVAWQAAAEHSAGLERRIRYTLITCSIRSLAANLTADLLRQLGATGLWRWEAVLANALQAPQVHQEKIFRELIPWIPSTELDNTLAAVDRLATEQFRAEMLRSLAKNSPAQWSTDQAQKALAIAEGLQDQKLRAPALAQLAVVMPDRLRTNVVQSALKAAASTIVNYNREDIWKEVLPLVPDGSKEEAVSIAAAEIGDEWNRGNALAAVARYMDPAAIRKLVDKVLSFRSHWAQADALARLLSELPPAERGWLPFRGLLLSLLAQGYTRYRIVTKFLPFLPPWMGRSLSWWIMTRVPKLEEAASRAKLSLEVIEYVSEGRQPAVADQLFAAVSQLPEPWERLHMLHDFTKRSPSSFKVTAANQAFAVLEEVPQRDHRFDYFIMLLPDLPDALFPRALEYMKSIDDSYQQERALSSLAPRLPDTLLSDAKALTVGIQDLVRRGHMLAVLAQNRSEHCRQWVLDTAEAIPDEYWRGTAFVFLAPVLQERVMDLVERARKIMSDHARAMTLVGLLEYVPADQQSSLFQEALKATRADYHLEAERLAQLIAYAPVPEKKQLADEALAVSRLINDRQQLTEGMANFFGSLSGAAQAELLDPLLLTIGHTETRQRFQDLKEVISRLSSEASVETQRRLLAAIDDGMSRDELLYDLIPRIGDEIVEEVLAVLAASDTGYGFYRPLVLARLSRRLSGEKRTRVIREAIDLAKPSLNRWHAAQIFIEFSDEVLAQDGGSGWHQVLAAACDSDQVGSVSTFGDVRRLWVELATRLPVELIPSALQSATTFADPKLRSAVLCRLAGRIERNAAASIIQQALEPLRTRLNEYDVRKHLISLADDLMPAHIPDLVTIVQAIPDEDQRTETLIAVAKRVPEQARHDVVQKAFESTRALSNEGWRAFALASLAPLLTSELLDSAFDLAKAMEGDDAKVVAYSALGARTPTHPRMASVEKIRSVAKTLEGRRLAETLVNLSCFVDQGQRIDVIREALIVIGKQMMSWERPELYRRVIAGWRDMGFGNERQVLADAMRALNGESRILLFESLAVLAPVFVNIGGVDAVREIIDSTNETRRWWP